MLHYVASMHHCSLAFGMAVEIAVPADIPEHFALLFIMPELAEANQVA
jgi:hypothetical protein